MGRRKFRLIPLILMLSIFIIFIVNPCQSQQEKQVNSEIEKHLKLADIFIKEGHYDLAELELQKCLQLAPKNEKVLLKMGYIYVMNGKLDEALRWYNDHLSAISNAQEVFTNMARVYMKKGELDKALRTVDKALDIAPQFVPAYFTKVQIFLKKGEKHRAKEILKIAQQYVQTKSDQNLINLLKNEIESSR